MLIAGFSLAIFYIWLGYNQHVQPWIARCQHRLWEIEKELNEIKNTPRIHILIKNLSSARALDQIGGVRITQALVIVVTNAWALRLLFLWKYDWVYAICILILVFVITFLISCRILIKGKEWTEEIIKKEF